MTTFYLTRNCEVDIWGKDTTGDIVWKGQVGKSRDQVSMNLSQMSYGKIFTRPNNRVTKLTMRGRKTSLCSGEVGASEREPEPVSCSCRQEASEWWRRRWRGRWRGSRGSQRFYTGLPPPQTSPRASPELGHLTRVYSVHCTHILTLE